MYFSTEPIGVFDSGVGGLSILRRVHEVLPQENVIYFADQEWVPYGSRSPMEVRERSVMISSGLIDRGAKIVAVACNSASAVALHSLREAFPGTPFVGMEPALKPAAEWSDTGKVGVLATEATFQGDLYESVLNRYAGHVEVHAVAGERLARLVEAGDYASALTDLEDLLEPMLVAGVDVIVLGCTHYSFLERQIRYIVGDGVRLIDSAYAVARQVKRVLHERDSTSSAELDGSTLYVTTGDPARLTEQIEQLTGQRRLAVGTEMKDWADV